MNGGATAPAGRIKLGVIAGEFFDPALGRMGGFGWAAGRAAQIFNGDPALGVEVVFLAASGMPARAGELRPHGARLIPPGNSRGEITRRLRAEGIDLLLAIDYRPSYRPIIRALRRVPLIVWVRDPHAPADWLRIATLRAPGQGSARLQGMKPIDCTSLRRFARAGRWFGRRVLFATPAPHLHARAESAYGLPIPDLRLLPNPIDLDPREAAKSIKPVVIFLARLDPIKRPWLFLELARRVPEAEFLVLGEAQAKGAAAWTPGPLPANVRLLGHAGEAEKTRRLASAWALVNTALHEGLAVSFLEALSCETPLLAGVDPGGVVSRFGIFAGEWNGDGVEGLPRFEQGLRRLLGDRELRERLGKQGRRWVEETHNPRAFLESFNDLRRRAGLPG